MTVLQLISSSLGYYGAERVVVTLSAALEEMGVSSIVGAFDNTAKTVHIEVHDQAQSQGLKAERLACHGRLDRQALLTIRRIIEHHKIDVIHCHGIKAVLYAPLAARHGNIPVISTCHLWTFDSTKEWFISALERCLLHTVDHVVAVSDAIVPQLRRFGVRGDVIYNGIDLEPYRNPMGNYKQTMNWCDRLVIGSIARLAPQKGLHYLLQAAVEVLREIPSALFVFVGDGPERQSLEAEAKRLGIQRSVCFLGVRKDIPELLSAIDVLAMPSLSEGLPMALLEAMASGKAVVATRVGAIPRVIEDRVNGIILSPGDVQGLTAALRDLLKCSDLRIKLGQRARETIESSFSAAVMAKAYLEIYRGATSMRRSQFSSSR